ncbi:hypothetical protein ACQ4PT_019025 [Festuca glaucescens]
MRDHWPIPIEEAFRNTGKDWLLVLLSSTDVCIRAKIMLILWRAWHLGKDVVHHSDVIGIVVDVSPVRFHKTFEHSTPCRDVMLLNIRREFICMRIWDKHVSRHMMKWRRAEREMSILAATLLEVSEAQGALKSTDES